MTKNNKPILNAYDSPASGHSCVCWGYYEVSLLKGLESSMLHAYLFPASGTAAGATSRGPYPQDKGMEPLYHPRRVGRRGCCLGQACWEAGLTGKGVEENGVGRRGCSTSEMRP